MCTVLHALTFGCWQDERERETAIHQRLEKKWLGNIRIPFSTIYLNGKVSLSVFWALWATSKTLSLPSTPMERPVCPSSGHCEQHQKPFLHHLERSVCPSCLALVVFILLLELESSLALVVFIPLLKVKLDVVVTRSTFSILDMR